MPEVHLPEFDSKSGCWIIRADAIGPNKEELFLHVDLNIYNDIVSYINCVLTDTGRYIDESSAMAIYKNYCLIYGFNDKSTSKPVSNGAIVNSQPLFDD